MISWVLLGLSLRLRLLIGIILSLVMLYEIPINVIHKVINNKYGATLPSIKMAVKHTPVKALIDANRHAL
jgi:hypothetical protein